MMTPFEYIATNPTLEDSRSKWLVFSASLAADLQARQDEVVSSTHTVHRISPIQLTDGRYAVKCDLVTEIQGGVFTPHFQALDQNKLAQATIEDAADILPLIPQPEQEL